MKKTFEVLPVGSATEVGDVVTTTVPRGYGTVPPGNEGCYLRPVKKEKRETITHDGVEYDAEQVDGPYTGQLVATESFVVGKLGALGVTYHAPVTVEPEEPSADYINNSYISRYIEWAKEEIARLREDLGESS